MNSRLIYIIVGTRPNFIKVTAFRRIAKKYPRLKFVLVHTGQHYDEKMADVFFKQFNLEPDHYLNISPGAPAVQIAEIMMKLQNLVKETGKPDLILVPGDVNSTLAGALFANKTDIKLGHIEAGLRSFDRSMPEEINRIIADEISDYFFVTEPSGMKHLIAEGKTKENIFFVGNTMIDTMVDHERQIDDSDILNSLDLLRDQFILMTMHRPATVDVELGLSKLVDLLQILSSTHKIVFPIHPRTIKRIEEFGLMEKVRSNHQIILTDPLDYFSFQKLVKECKVIITDSGGIQEESTYRKKPCLTLRDNTERPVTVETGSNTLLSFDINQVQTLVTQIEKGAYKKGKIPELWDGKSTERIVNILDKIL